MHITILLLLTIIAILNTKQCYTATVLKDFNKGTKFRLVKTDEQKNNGMPGYLKPPQKAASSSSAIDDICTIEKSCSSGNQFQIQPKTKVGCISNCLKPPMGERDDIEFVYYTPGSVTYCESDKWVLSGLFTGCLMAIWNRKGNTRCVGHIHTDSGEPGKICKRKMVTKTGQFFKPAENTDIRGLFDKYGSVSIFGLVSADNRFYTVYAKIINLKSGDNPNDDYEILENPTLRTDKDLNEIQID